MYKNVYVNEWVEQMAKMTQPDSIVWIDGSEEERERLTKQAVSTGEMMELNSEKLPGCLYHRTAENDVARVEHLTFICTSKKEDAGPTNNWMEKSAAYAKLGTLFEGCMKGRTMYVIPYIMGPAFSEFSKVGIEITDSIYVVLNMRIMTRMGKVAMDMLGDSPNFVKGLHSKGELDPEKRFICHFPEDNAIWSIGSGYGGNVLLGKKCFALRIASWLGRKEGWMAEHMLILGVEDPSGNIQYVSAAFPSACGKTNLAMLIPPEKYREKGYKVWTVGDDIAWLRIGPDGRLWAVNPEAGFFWRCTGNQHEIKSERASYLSEEYDFHKRGFDSGKDGLVGRHGRTGAGACDRLERKRMDAGYGYESGASEFPFYRSRKSVPLHFEGVGESCRRADYSDDFRRQTREGCSAGLPVVQLGARCVRRRDDGLGNNGGRYGRSRRRKKRSDGNASVLRIQYGRVFPALAGDGQENPESA